MYYWYTQRRDGGYLIGGPKWELQTHLNCILADNTNSWSTVSVESGLDGVGECGREFPSVRNPISLIVWLVTKLLKENPAICGLLA